MVEEKFCVSQKVHASEKLSRETKGCTTKLMVLKGNSWWNNSQLIGSLATGQYHD